MTTALVLAGASLTRRSADHGANLEALLADRRFFDERPVEVGPFTVPADGSIPAATLDDVASAFAVPPKNLKYFDAPSTALFHCMAPLRRRLDGLPPAAIGLYVNLGPANARLDDFDRWAAENDPSGTDAYTSMMASSVVRLLPNVVMSNLAANLAIHGENAATAGTAVTSAWSVGAALRVLYEGTARAVLVGSASFPYQYFNVAAFRRCFGSSYWQTTPCEAASALALVRPAARYAGDEVLGTVIGQATCVTGPDGTAEEALDRMGLDPSGLSFVLEQPRTGGDFLAAAEPLGLLAALRRLAAAGGGRAASLCRDRFGAWSAVVVAGPGNELY